MTEAAQQGFKILGLVGVIAWIRKNNVPHAVGVHSPPFAVLAEIDIGLLPRAVNDETATT